MHGVTVTPAIVRPGPRDRLQVGGVHPRPRVRGDLQGRSRRRVRGARLGDAGRGHSALANKLPAAPSTTTASTRRHTFHYSVKQSPIAGPRRRGPAPGRENVRTAAIPVNVWSGSTARRFVGAVTIVGPTLAGTRDEWRSQAYRARTSRCPNLRLVQTGDMTEPSPRFRSVLPTACPCTSPAGCRLARAVRPTTFV